MASELRAHSALWATDSEAIRAQGVILLLNILCRPAISWLPLCHHKFPGVSNIAAIYQVT